MVSLISVKISIPSPPPIQIQVEVQTMFMHYFVNAFQLNSLFVLFKECKDNTWGKDCRETCFPCRHVNGPCDKRYGNCSCGAGFVGFKCEQDCPLDRYGNHCLQQCTCDSRTELCNNLNGNCYERESHVTTINLVIDSLDFRKEQYAFQENLEIILSKCFHQFDIAVEKEPNKNITDIPKCQAGDFKETGQFIARVVSIGPRYTSSDQSVTSISISVLKDSMPVNSTYLENVLVFIGFDNFSQLLKMKFYNGKVFNTPQNKPWYKGSMKWMAVGLSCKYFLLFNSHFTLLVILLVVNHVGSGKPCWSEEQILAYGTLQR